VNAAMATPLPTTDQRVAVLQAQALCLTLGPHRAVNNLTFDLRSREWTAIVGPNGAGKSSLLQLLAGLHAPDSGQVLLSGKPLLDWSPRQRAHRLAWLSQQGEADGDIAAIDVVRLGRLPHQGLLGAATAADEAAVQSAMAQTECTAFAQRRLGALSGGERQRVLLARALAVGAPVLLLDEPTTHLDAPHQRALLRCLAAHAAAGGAVAVVLHDLGLALAAPRVVVMDQGRLVADGAPADPALQAALMAVFGHAFSIHSVPTAHGPRWVTVPSV
jgi:iron complex transport system ATP-binding protein